MRLRVSVLRHHLIFGRRGRQNCAEWSKFDRPIEDRRARSVWMNMQTYRHEPIQRIFLYFVQKICDAIAMLLQGRTVDAERCAASNRAGRAGSTGPRPRRTSRSRMHSVLSQRCNSSIGRSRECGRSSALRLHGRLRLPQREPNNRRLLDMFHGCVRDTDAWLKIASIRHLTRWFQSSPPLGLQTGHDAAHVDLDVTLQDPQRATQFLESVLLTYAQHAGVRRLSAVYARGALDCLVLASGAVPRDYLTLAANALTRAQTRKSEARGDPGCKPSGG